MFTIATSNRLIWMNMMRCIVRATGFAPRWMQGTLSCAAVEMIPDWIRGCLGFRARGAFSRLESVHYECRGTPCLTRRSQLLFIAEVRKPSLTFAIFDTAATRGPQ
jgi:hypothetical protein